MQDTANQFLSKSVNIR